MCRYPDPNSAFDYDTQVPAAEIAAAGKMVTFVARDPSVAPEMEHHSSIAYRKTLAEHDVRVLLEYELISVRAREGRRDVVLRHLLTGRELRETHAQVIVEHGTMPVTTSSTNCDPFR